MTGEAGTTTHAPEAGRERLLTSDRAYVLLMLVLVYTFNFIDRQIVGILAVPIKADLGLSDTQLGLMGGLAFALFYTGLGIPVAMLADRFSRTWIMTVALAVWSAMTAVCGLAQNFGSCSWRAWASASARRAAWRRPIR
jgi:sugar phosphate permease